MCGIAGFITGGMTGDADRLARLAERMGETIAHRGPDASGVYVDEACGVGLAHRRLSILDLSESGAQPMASADGAFILAHNGEIYNFLELRAELEQRSGPFLPWRSDSDTEVMLAAFQVWGVEGALKRFTGMFAFALWDANRRMLFLARDRMGEKPLYYGQAKSSIVFGSELKALRAHPDFVPNMDMEALSLYLRYQYVPEPRSIYKGIHKLPPGHFLALGADDPALRRPRPYWSLADRVNAGQADPFVGSEKQAADELETLLRSVVANQMLSDVPLGALLSGGVDSSLVTALMQAESSRPVRSFTIGFTDKSYDESAHAKLVAAHLGTDHTELTVTPDHVLDLIPRLPELYDEPFADASQLPTFLVAELTRQHVTVCLTGDGGDETFAGYNRHFWAPSVWNRIKGMPTGLRRFTADAMRFVSPKTYDSLFRLAGQLMPHARGMRQPGHKVHKLAEVLSADSREQLYTALCSTWADPGALLSVPEPVTPYSGPNLADYTRWMQYMDTTTYLPGDILHKVDRATMGVALESRTPFLDHRVVEFAWRLPLSMLLKGRQGKRILKSVLYRHVPKKLVERPKMGFGIPIDLWLRGPLKDWAHNLLSPDRLRKQGLFNEDEVSRQLADHMKGKRDNQYRIWNLLMFQAWHDRWL